MSKTKKRKLKPKISGTLPRVLKSFQPYVAEWFIRTFNAPSPAQKKAWPAIRRGDNENWKTVFRFFMSHLSKRSAMTSTRI
jgi:hypothetical protein